MRMLILPVLAVLTLANCNMNTAGLPGTTMATNGSLSVEAIRLQASSEKLLTLEQEQEAARKRLANYGVQGAAIGAAVGAAAGAGLACLTQRMAGGDCDATTMAVGATAGGVAGGVYGNKKGKDVAQAQNEAAGKENAIKRRLQVASQQLDTARTARQQAEQVAALNQKKLARLKADVAAGRASRSQLEMARADAKADANQIRKASASMGSSAGSLGSNDGAAQAQGASRTKTLNNASATMQQEQARTNAQYNALVTAINEFAL